MTIIERMDEITKAHATEDGFWSFQASVLRLTAGKLTFTANVWLWLVSTGEPVQGNGRTITEAIDDLERQLAPVDASASVEQLDAEVGEAVEAAGR